jgi:hypothetical protein
MIGFGSTNHGTFRKAPPEARTTIDGLQWPCAAHDGMVGLLDDKD